jgi:glycosyltransferase involved in cell wall biosynthesis
MRVLQITVRADVGGGPEHLNQLLGGLPQDVEAHVACPRQAPYWDIYQRQVNGRVLELPYRQFSLTSLLRLLKYAREQKIDVIHTHGKGAGVYGRACATMLRLPLVHTLHGVHVGAGSRVQDFVYKAYERISEPVIDKVLFVSESEQQTAWKNGLYRGAPSVVINNGVVSHDVQPSTRQALRAKFRERYGLHQDAVICVSLSRFDYAKNSSAVIDIAKVCPQVQFVLFGDGPDRPAMLERVRVEQCANLLLPGFTSEPVNVMLSSDIYLGTSRWEGLPLSVLEAMSCALPVVASKVTGHVDCIKDGVTGALFELDDLSGAASIISRLAAQPEQRSAYGKAGLERQKALFGVKEMVRRIVTEYQNLCSAGA